MKKIVCCSLLLASATNSLVAKKPKQEKQVESQSPKEQKPPITEAEAGAMLQVAGGFLQILTNPKEASNISTGIGAMAAGMANLLYQLMKAKGVAIEMSDDELHELANEMADMVNRGVQEEVVRRNI